LPQNALIKFRDRETLRNSVDEAEIREDARTAREVEVALPIELELDENVKLVNDYIVDNFVRHGLVADVAIHDKGVGNPHAHILLTTRETDINGFVIKKNRNWDKRHNLEVWRKEWAKAVNKELERKGLEIRISHERLELQGIHREPTKHLGYIASKLEKQGILTDRGNENRAIVARNLEKERGRGRSADRSR